MIDNEHSFLDSAEHLKRCGAAEVYIVATHGILSGCAMDNIEECEAVKEVCFFQFTQKKPRKIHTKTRIDYRNQFLSNLGSKTKTIH